MPIGFNSPQFCP